MTDKQWTTVLGCLLAAVTYTAAQSSGCFFDDLHGRVQPIDPVALVGSTIALNCTIRPDEDGVTAHRAYWKHGTETIPEENYRVLSDTVAQLVLENVVLSSAGRYECLVPEPNDRPCGAKVGGAELEVGYAPEEPVLDGCISYNLGPLSCTWHKGRDTLIRTDYSITYTYHSDQEHQECEQLEVKGDDIVCQFAPEVRHVGNLPFHVTVTAENQFGREEASYIIYAQNHVKPSPVRNLRVTGQGSRSVSLTWDAPDDTSHFPLLYQAVYRAEWDTQDTVRYMNLSRLTRGELTGLNPFTTYDICIHAHPVQLDSHSKEVTGTEGYWGDCPEQWVSVRTESAAPVGSVPAWLHITSSRDPGVRNAVVYWKELPPRDQNGDITDYTVTVASRSRYGLLSPNGDRTFPVPGDQRHLNLSALGLQLQADTSYTVKVYASNEKGRSQDTVLLIPQDGNVPVVPSTINVNVTSPTSVQLSWQPPVETRFQITGYIVFWRALRLENQMYAWGEPDWDSIAVDRSSPAATVEHDILCWLEGRTRYRFGVVPVSSMGFGEAKVVDAYTEEIAPVGRVEDLTVTAAGPTALQVAWEPLQLQLRGGILQGYMVQYCQHGDTQTCIDRSTQTVPIPGEEAASCLLQDLKPFTQYAVRVWAENLEGYGPLSDYVVQITAEAAPEDPPTNLHFPLVTATVLRLSWDEPRVPNGLITYYTAEVSGETHQLVDNNTVPVHGNTNYTVRLRACTTVGCGPLSANYSVTTPIGVPDAPPPPTISELLSSPSVVHLQLTPPLHPNGPISYFNISYAPKNSRHQQSSLMQHVQTVEGTLEAAVEVPCAEDRAVVYQFWVQAVNRDEKGELLYGNPSEKVERLMCQVAAARVEGVPIAIVIPTVAGTITVVLVAFLVWKNRHRMKRKLFPKVPGPVLFLEEDGPYSTLYVVTPTNPREPEVCDCISDFIGKDSEGLLLTDGQHYLKRNESTKVAPKFKQSTPTLPLGSMSYVSRQENDSHPFPNGISQTPQSYVSRQEHNTHPSPDGISQSPQGRLPSDDLEMTLLCDVPKTPCEEDRTQSPGAYIKVHHEGDEDFYCETGTLLDKTSPGLTKPQISQEDDVPYVTNFPSPLPNDKHVKSKPVRELPRGEDFGYQMRHSVESLCDEKDPLFSNQEDHGRSPGNQELKDDINGYVRRSMPDGTFVTRMPDSSPSLPPPKFGPYTPH